MQNFIKILIPVFIILLSSCERKSQVTNTQVEWSGNDPMAIPYWVRQQKYEKGNLVRNGSFESGKNIIVDSTGVTFRVDGWEKIGQDLQWVNIEENNAFSTDEAFDSIRAIKIVRNTPDETDEVGEGVMSDFIKVIPGNYQLTLFLRLKDVKSSLERMGLPLYDAVNIRLFFYDKNKIKISSNKFDPFSNSKVDYSFKSLSLSGFWQIPQMPWTWVIGKSVNSPLSDGDIPDDARYVKIFLGLKGTGTMWVDKIDFRYTRLNFTAMELMQKFLDTTLLKHEILVPYPKQITKTESLKYYDPGDRRNLPVIVIPSEARPETIEAANLLKKKIEGLVNDKNIKIEILTHIPRSLIARSNLVFSLGKNELYRKYREILPVNSVKNKPQAYFIYTPSDLSNIVFVCGSDAEGDYYAATTAIQLFDSKKYIFHNARIIDYPDLTGRYVGYKSEAENYSDPGFFTTKKINGVYQYTEYKKSGFSAVKNIENSLLHSKLLLINKNSDLINDKAYLSSYENKAVSIKRMENNLTFSQLNTNHTDYTILPFWCNNEGLNQSMGEARLVLKDLNGTRYFWNGGSPFSFKTDQAELFRIISVTGYKPIWWDNSMYIYDIISQKNNNPEKKDLYNLFEPFINTDVKQILSFIDSSGVFINYAALNELDEIKLTIISDFLWNINTFDPELSLWRTLHLRYGKECAKELILFNNDYASLLKTNAFLSNPDHYQKYFRKGDNIKISLNNRLETIGSFIGATHPLVTELRKKAENLISEFNKYEKL